MSVSRTSVNGLPQVPWCLGPAIAITILVCCHGAGPPLTLTGCQESWPGTSGTTGPPVPKAECASGTGWCDGKYTFRMCDGITRHCGRPAPNYPVPFPTPLPTTPTLLWYPPMMPHNSLPHYRSSYSYRHAPGLSRTTVSWHPTYFWNALDKLHHVIELPR